jgi:hypothetical protein
MYVEGSGSGSIGQVLKVNPQSVVNWLKADTAKLLAVPVPNRPRTAELDELYNITAMHFQSTTLCIIALRLLPGKFSNNSAFLSKISNKPFTRCWE